MTGPAKIDVHAHYAPESYRDALTRAGHTQPDGFAHIPAWSADEHVAGFALPRQLDALLTMTTLEHLHYGSDYPFTPEAVAGMAAERIAAAGDPPGSLLPALRHNTERLFPALGARRR